MLARMAAAVRHRGPDGFGLYVGDRVGLAHVRLSIIDLETGAQPLGNEDGSVVVVFNGEIFNYIELRDELRTRGHGFRTTSDTEVLVRGYEEWGDRLVDHLNGDFAFALYDRRLQRVLLARDRFGVRPLFYADTPSGVYFASEVKALFASGAVQPAPDPEGLDQVFTFWSALPPRTVFRGVRALEPGTLAVVADGAIRVRRYYQLDCRTEAPDPPDALERLDALLRSSVSQRLRADVPVGGYLSGGLDSSVCCLLAMRTSPYPLRTFSIAFEEPSLDESGPQRLVAEALHTLHAVQRTRTSDIGVEFPEVLRHTETPLVRTAPVPMYLLAGLTRRQGIKVVLTGEGSDELFLGYDLFKEVALRLFCLRHPESRARPRLFDRLYPYLDGGQRAGDFWRRFFLSAGGPEDPL
ncbi:MAG TPA: asparagine synthase (glutamine-hydrolyzing), partial [Gemmatimonadales bacterium]|nr:asparagine synthase (glutamine-hydrolyzing) [Gemmatimonadales bacterium]